MDNRGPNSPCINICSLDERGICRGCSRTLAEIAGWTDMDLGEQWAVIERASRRRQAVLPRRSRR